MQCSSKIQRIADSLPQIIEKKLQQTTHQVKDVTAEITEKTTLKRSVFLFTGIIFSFQLSESNQGPVGLDFLVSNF